MLNFNLCSVISVFLASKGKETWFENRVVREIVGAGVGVLNEGLKGKRCWLVRVFGGFEN